LHFLLTFQLPTFPVLSLFPSTRIPTLIVQGERDPFGTPAELAPVSESMRAPVTLHVVTEGDHSLTVTGQQKEQVYESIISAIAHWIGTPR
jgi:predicted alpha/beta-hydrolase family hydrolase